MTLFAVLLFLIVFSFSALIYLFSKRLIYKLNKRVLARNLAVLKNGAAMNDFENLNEQEIRDRIIIPFFQIMGYNTYDRREFGYENRRVDFLADYITKKYDNSRLCKCSLYIKYYPFSEGAVNLKDNTYNDNRYKGCDIDELMNKLYFEGEYFCITNGYLYLFFSKNHKTGSKKYSFCFNLKNYSKKDIAKLAYFTKQYMFLEIADVYKNA